MDRDHRENISPATAAAAFIYIVGTIAIALIMLAVKQRSAASTA